MVFVHISSCIALDQVSSILHQITCFTLNLPKLFGVCAAVILDHNLELG